MSAPAKLVGSNLMERIATEREITLFGSLRLRYFPLERRNNRPRGYVVTN